MDTTAPAPLRYALLGCGGIGRKRLAALAPGQVKVLCDADPARAHALAPLATGSRVATDPAVAVSAPDVDAVIVATTHEALAPLAAAALRAGKHVFLEKPGAIRAAELEELAALATTANRCVRVGYNHRFHPAARQARALVNDGTLGDLMFLRARYGHGGRLGYEKEWRANPALSGGGELIDQGVHLIDLAGWFLGAFDRVEGHLATCFWNMPVEDNAFVSLRTAAGQTAWLHASCTEWKNLFSLELYGRHAKLHWEGLGGSYGAERLTCYRMLPQMGPPEATVYEYPGADESWALELREFAADIQLGRRPEPGLAEARATLRIVETLYRQPNGPAAS